MRSPRPKTGKKPNLLKMKSVPIKKKKVADIKPSKDTISETISFVIKGKLTPIKPAFTTKELDLHKNVNSNAPNTKKEKISTKQPTRLRKTLQKNTVSQTKVQVKTARKPASVQKIIKKTSEKTPPINNNNQTDGSVAPVAKKKRTSKPVIVNNKLTKNKSKEKKPPKIIKSTLEETKKKANKITVKKEKKSEVATAEKLPKTIVAVVAKEEEPTAEDKKSLETIQKLLLQEANKVLKTKCVTQKKKKDRTKVLGDKKLRKAGLLTKTKVKNPVKITQKSNVKQSNFKTKTIDEGSLSDEISLNELCSATTSIKTEPTGQVDIRKLKNETEDEIKSNTPLLNKGKTLNKKTKKGIVLKKMQEKTQNKSKLFGFWNGPKKHRVASLNALAKVHCLYENESSRNNILESSDVKKVQAVIKKDSDPEPSLGGSTRTLRSVPGLRAIGKHWEMHESSSSSEDNNSSSESVAEMPSVKVKKELVKKVMDDDDKKPIKKRRRNRTELIMDLKDMVVRKRMASLNASAILAASYSVEKRGSVKSPKTDDSDTDSSDDYFLTTDDEERKSCIEDDVSKEEERKVIEVHTTPNKKVAVILNQDTDVTITGVYVNSTTRSTHQDGYCSIAGMQYRISATSHTQTAATAVATETLLQSSSSSAQESSNSDTTSTKSYTPLDALSNMQPPPGPGIQHGHPILHGQNMGPPLPLPTHQLSPGRRHGCSSAFSSPHATPSYPPPPPGHHHLPIQGDIGYVHGYYQPAGPLITVPHGHAQPPPTKSAPLSEASPNSSTPPVSHQPPPPSSSTGDSSDSEVIITSVTMNKESLGSIQPPSYRCPQYTAGPGYSYSYPYHYSTPPPSAPSYTHHDLCYPPSPYVHHKYPPTTYRRYITGPPYYSANPQEIYPLPPNGPSQQLVTATPVPASGTTFQAVPNGPPAPTLIETYPPPQPTLVESYQPPPPHCYPAYGPPPSCYTHASTRAIPYMSTAYQSCPCPMQSCPKNVLTGPLTGDSKRSSISTIVKDTMPLPPVALALPLEPASATGPPSPARGSAGMPPPPSPAGATYQAPPVPKQESQSPEVEDSKTDLKRKPRIGKDMVRNTMLLMCNPTQNYVKTVKREIESPKEKELEQKPNEMFVGKETEKIESFVNNKFEQELKGVKVSKENENHSQVMADELVLSPCVLTTVAENVKVKNMKRKLSMCKEKEAELPPPSPINKKQKLGSYKDFIKKDTTTVKINSGKRKLIDESTSEPKPTPRTSKLRLKTLSTKRKLCATSTSKEEPFNKRLKLSQPLTASNLHNSKQNCKYKEKSILEQTTVPQSQKKTKKSQILSKSAPALLDNLIAKNNVDKVIESVVSELIPQRTSTASALKTVKSVTRESYTNKKSTNTKKNIPVKIKSEDKKNSVSRRKWKCKEIVVPQAVSKIPRRSLQLPKWSNGWTWEGESYESKVFLNSDEATVVRRCYPAMRHCEGDVIVPRDTVLLKAGAKKNELPFVAKIATLWENPDDGEMMMSLLWYYRPEHTEAGRSPRDHPAEVYASRHKDSNSVACIDDKCYVVTFNEYCRYRKKLKAIEEGIEDISRIPIPESYPKLMTPTLSLDVSPEMVFFCHNIYDFKLKKLLRNPKY